MPVFDEYLQKDRLHEILAGATGKGVKVGIVDTGVESTHPYLDGSIKACHDVQSTSGGKYKTGQVAEGTDLVGHGTACAGIIRDLAPDVELYSVRVIGGGHGDTLDKLIEGMRFALEQDWPIVNLSLGTSQFNRDLFRLAEQAFYDGKILIAAKDNQRHKVGYPAALSAVVAVDMEHFESALTFRYRMREQVEVEAKGIYVNAPSPGGGFQLYTGTSFACPQVSGIAARFKEAFEDLNAFQFRAILSALRTE